MPEGEGPDGEPRQQPVEEELHTVQPIVRQDPWNGKIGATVDIGLQVLCWSEENAAS